MDKLIIHIFVIIIEKSKMRNLQLNSNKKQQLINQIMSMDDSDKMEIFSELKKSLFQRRLDNLLKTTRTDDISMETITEEVEKVRKERYEKGLQKH